MEINREDYQQKMNAQLKDWAVKIGALRTKADKATPDIKIELNKKLAGIKDLESQAAVLVDRVKAASKESWKDLNKTVEEGWTKLAAAFDAAVPKA